MEEIKSEKKGVLVFYIAVGLMSPVRVGEYIAKLEEKFSKKFTPSNMAYLIIPVRPPQMTTVCYIPFDNTSGVIASCDVNWPVEEEEEEEIEVEDVKVEEEPKPKIRWWQIFKRMTSA